jgi:type III secretory pathway component EscS
MLGIVTQGKRVQVRLKSLAQLSVELAKTEEKRKAIALSIALGLAVLAAVLVLYAVGFVFAAAAAVLDEELPLWLSLLVVAVAILVAAIMSGLIAASFARKGSPPGPTQAIDETKRTMGIVRSHV